MNKSEMQKQHSDSVAQVLQKMQGSPSASQDNAVCKAADRLLGPASSRRKNNWQVPVALAASLLLAVPLALQLHQQSAPSTSTVRTVASPTVPFTGQRLTTVPRQLRWPAVAGASGYRVTLRDSSAEVLWTSAVVTPSELDLPEAAARAITGLDTCIWSVEVVGVFRQNELGPFWFHFGNP